MSLTMLLLILALVSFILGAANVPARVAWTPLGLAFWVLTLLLR